MQKTILSGASRSVSRSRYKTAIPFVCWLVAATTTFAIYDSILLRTEQTPYNQVFYLSAIVIALISAVAGLVVGIQLLEKFRCAQGGTQGAVWTQNWTVFNAVTIFVALNTLNLKPV